MRLCVVVVRSLLLVFLCCATSWAQSPVRGNDTAANENYCFGCPASTRIGPHPRSTEELIRLASAHDNGLRQAVEETYAEKPLELGRVWSSHLHDFFFAVRTTAEPTIIIDDRPGPAMQRVEGTDLWYTVAHIDRLGALHGFHYQVAGKYFGGSGNNMPALTELSYPVAGVPRGMLAGKQTLHSKIYEGIHTDYWVYTPAGYDEKAPAAVMVFLDGGNFLSRQGGSKVLDVVDNLIYLKRIPMMLLVFVDPGKIDPGAQGATVDAVRKYAESTHRNFDQAMRSVQQDVVSDQYARFLRDELLPALGAQYKLRKDAYSHAITGLSSGGIAAFNAAWQTPGVFSRVASGISSFTSIQWKTPFAANDAGQDYPDKVLQEQHRNIRVWIQSGSDDLETDDYGSWPLNNIRMANALKMKNYDFHFVFGNGGHGPDQMEVQLPEEMTWLWRDYDPAKTEQTFQIDPAEKAKPAFRVEIVNRNAE